MKKWSMFILLFTLVTGCQSTAIDSPKDLLPNTHVEIDWVDFLKWEGIEYNGIHSGVLADKTHIGEKLGEIQFKVADNISNSSYKIKDGDAAFHEKGTAIYAINGYPNLLAVESTHAINGYEVYYSTEETKYEWHFKDMPLEKVRKIEIHQAYTPEGTTLVNGINNKEEVDRFLDILEKSEENPNFQPDTLEKDPAYYHMIFYTDGPIAYKYGMQFDGTTFYWHPWDTSILSEEISSFLNLQN